MHAPVLIAAAAETPVSTVEAKAHLRVDGDDDTALIGSLVAAATGHLDGYTGILGRCLVTQSWRQDFDEFSRVMRLPFPVAGITSIVSVDDEGTTSSAIAAANYDLQHDGLGSFVRFIDTYAFPSGLAETRAVRVTFTAGYGAADAVPSALKAAILLLIGHWYGNREAVVTGTIATELPMAVAALIEPYRRVGI
jgi:uncharacterized phiE125 gp8 family phage protein